MCKIFDQFARNWRDRYLVRILPFFRLWKCEIFSSVRLGFIKLIAGQNPFFLRFRHGVKIPGQWAWNLFDLYPVGFLCFFFVFFLILMTWNFLTGEVGIRLIYIWSESSFFFIILGIVWNFLTGGLELVGLILGQNPPFFSNLDIGW